MKILFTWHSIVEKEYQNIFDYFINKNDEITVVCPGCWFEGGRLQKVSSREMRNYRLIALSTLFTNKIKRFFYINVFRLAKLIKNHKPDIIHIFEEPYSLACFEIILLTRLFSPGSKIVVQSFENIKPAHRLFIFDKLQKYVLKRSNAIIAVPEEGNNIWRKAGFEGSIYQLPVGINRNTFKKINTPEYRYLKKPEEITIFYVGRLVEEKGINLLLLAFLDLLKTEEKIKLVLVGSGPQKEYLQKLSEKAKIQNSIVFLAPVVNAKIPELFSVADILVLPSVSTKIWKEQFGRVLIEAMACGVAVVGSSSGEIPNVIDKAGIIFKEGDEKDLVSALRILINSPETLNQYKKMGLQRIVEKYTWDIIMRDLSEIYNMVLKK